MLLFLAPAHEAIFNQYELIAFLLIQSERGGEHVCGREAQTEREMNKRTADGNRAGSTGARSARRVLGVVNLKMK